MALPRRDGEILIDYDRLRYHLLPYIYSVAWKVTHENYTMMRGLVLDFPHDPKVFNIPDQYMFGPALLVNPVTKSASLRHRDPVIAMDRCGWPGRVR